MPTFNRLKFGEVKKRFPGLEYRDEPPGHSTVFVKTSDHDVFTAEAAGLDALRNTDTIRIANVIGLGRSKDYVIVLEFIAAGAQPADFYQTFGRELAQLHLAGSSARFGFPTDNFIGLNPQTNAASDSWGDFWARHRLRRQLDLAIQNKVGNRELQRLGQNLINRLESLIGGSTEPPTLIHGDLWSGNWICGAGGRPTLIDPAVYYANREAEFGMTTLFGGLPREFYEAYDEVWPLESGWEERVVVYRLYHLLNHLNLFGNSYLSDCLAILRAFQ